MLMCDVCCDVNASLRTKMYGRTHELAIRATGRLAIGMDEAGVGTIAGPVVAAAVLLPADWSSAAIAVDSKSLSRSERLTLFEQLDGTPNLWWSVGVQPHHCVDALGPREAALVAMQIASRRLEERLGRRQRDGGGATLHPFYLVDGEYLPPGLDGRAIVHGDREETAIAAASIIAAAAHDAAMHALARRWPLWELDCNAGWPSQEHLRHIAAYGPSPCHRAQCFPFQRRHGKRMAFHRDRAVYQKVQRELQHAALSLAEAPGGSGSADEHWAPAALDGTDGDARAARYRSMLLRAQDETWMNTLEGGSGSTSLVTSLRRSRSR